MYSRGSDEGLRRLDNRIKAVVALNRFRVRGLATVGRLDGENLMLNVGPGEEAIVQGILRECGLYG